MRGKIVGPVLAAVFFAVSQPLLQAQEVELFGRTVQFHGFASQGLVYTSNNNWLTMNTTNGSAAFTDFGFNASTQVTDKLRVGAQGYDRNLGQLGRYHPSLDWALADYRFTRWFGVRAGRVKTTLGLYNDTQDLDFLHTFALLPQSVYPTDLRDATLAHVGGDVYGTISLPQHLGDLSYTAYAGRRSDSIYSGYIYLAAEYFFYVHSLSGLQYGGDLRWSTPLKGLLIGISRLNQDLNVKGNILDVLNPSAGLLPYKFSIRSYWANQYYGQYNLRKLHLDAEYRRGYNEEPYLVTSSDSLDTRAWYLAGAYRISKNLEAGAYYSRYTVTSIFGGELSLIEPNQTDTSLPLNHVYDKGVSARIDLNRFWNLKVEGHFMNGYGQASYPDGFYPQQNPQGFQPITRALVVTTSVHF